RATELGAIPCSMLAAASASTSQTAIPLRVSERVFPPHRTTTVLETRIRSLAGNPGLRIRTVTQTRSLAGDPDLRIPAVTETRSLARTLVNRTCPVLTTHSLVAVLALLIKALRTASCAPSTC